jgi:hypothetical protein
MEDSEARYVIDQFNKYASWRMRLREVRLVALTFAIYLSLFLYLAILARLTVL